MITFFCKMLQGPLKKYSLFITAFNICVYLLTRTYQSYTGLLRFSCSTTICVCVCVCVIFQGQKNYLKFSLSRCSSICFSLHFPQYFLQVFWYVSGIERFIEDLLITILKVPWSHLIILISKVIFWVTLIFPFCLYMLIIS